MKYVQGLCLILLGASVLSHLVGWSRPLEIIEMLLGAVIGVFGIAAFVALPVALCIFGVIAILGGFEKGIK